MKQSGDIIDNYSNPCATCLRWQVSKQASDLRMDSKQTKAQRHELNSASECFFQGAVAQSTAMSCPHVPSDDSSSFCLLVLCFSIHSSHALPQKELFLFQHGKRRMPLQIDLIDSDITTFSGVHCDPGWQVWTEIINVMVNHYRRIIWKALRTWLFIYFRHFFLGLGYFRSPTLMM